MSDREERIRQKAHEIWLDEGMPEGRDEEIWFKAQEYIRREDFEVMVTVANTAPEAEDFAGLDRSDPAVRQVDTPVEAPKKSRKPRTPRAAKTAIAVTAARIAALDAASTGSR